MDWKSAIQQLKPNPKIGQLHPGDTVKVSSQVKEGDRVRTQVFQGVVIKRGGSGPSASFTVRKVSYGVGVERTFLVHSPLLESVEVVRRGSVRRAKLTYLRGLSAREARIKEKGREAAAPAPGPAKTPPGEAPSAASAAGASAPAAAPEAAPQAAASPEQAQ